MPAAVFDGDIDNKFNVGTLHSMGRKAICYVNVGSIEMDDSRPDFSQFTPEVIGEEYKGWDEKYIDIRSSVVRDIMLARFKKAAQAGCDGIEPDNMDSFAAPTGFNLTVEDGIEYTRWIISQVHGLGMAVGLKNTAVFLEGEYKTEIVNNMDFAVVEACVALGSCKKYDPMVQAGKPVFAAEYTDSGENGGCESISASKTADACSELNGRNFEGFLADCGLTGAVKYCQNYSNGARNGATGYSSSGMKTAVNTLGLTVGVVMTPWLLGITAALIGI
ncbi:hypothetical protein HDU97_009008 [Phlyctochytrium planicorne]|nr:hypothetical protein HDU97_009008 [Phlyctochytrium planicorne]